MPLPEKISKIVSLTPSVTETLLEMSEGTKLVGISSWCRVLGVARGYKELLNLPVAGTYGDIIEHAVKGADLVLLSGGYQKVIIPKLRELKVPYYVALLPKTAWDIPDMILQIATAVNKPKKGLTLSINYIMHLNEVRAEFNFPKLKTIVELNVGERVLPGLFSHIVSGLEFLGISTLNKYLHTPYLTGRKATRYAKKLGKKADLIIYEDNTLHPEEREIPEKVRDFYGLGGPNYIIFLPVLTLTDYGPRFVESLRILAGKLMELL